MRKRDFATIAFMLLLITAFACSIKALSATATSSKVLTPLAADTAVTTISWSVPSDGKGAIDSIRVNVTDLTTQPGTWISRTFPGATRTSHQVRQVLPYGENVWGITSQVCTYRDGLATCVSIENLLAGTAVPPLAVTGLTATSVKVVSP